MSDLKKIIFVLFCIFYLAQAFKGPDPEREKRLQEIREGKWDATFERVWQGDY